MHWRVKYPVGPGKVGLPIVTAALFAITAVLFAPRAYEAGLLLSEDNPAVLADHLLKRDFTSSVAEHEIATALAGNDIDLANSFVELARDRGVAIAPSLAERVVAANSTTATAARHAGHFARGLFTGEPDDLVSFAGTATGDLFVFGDVRDVARESYRLARGEAVDEMILGLACVGLAVTAGTYASLGLGAPARVGLSLVKVARKSGRMSTRLAGSIGRSVRDVVDAGALRRVWTASSLTRPAIAVRAARDAVKLEKVSALATLAGDVGRIEARAGTRAALDGLRLSEGPRDVARIAKLAKKEGGKTRAILKLLGRAVLAVGFLTFEGASWLLTAALMALGFCGALKGAAERATLRCIRYRKRRHERRQLRITRDRLATAPSSV